MIVLLFKLTIPVLILLFISFFSKERYEWFILIPSLLLLIPLSLTNLQVGMQYILPVLPLLFLYVSKIFVSKWGFIKSLALLLLFLHILASISIYPHYHSYFNEFAGGSDNGYKYLIGSNIGQGPDLKGLSAYLKENDIDRIKLSYFGSMDPNYYNISYDYLPYVALEHAYEVIPETCGPTKGIIAISVSYLQNFGFKNKTCYDWLKEYEPIHKIGYSIFIYNLTENQNI